MASEDAIPSQELSPGASSGSATAASAPCLPASASASPSTSTSAAAIASPSLPQKRTLEEDHTPRPSVPSPLNPEVRPTPKAQSQAGADDMPSKRTKKETFKKRESKGVFSSDSNRGTPDPKGRQTQQSRGEIRPPPTDSPLRYKLPPAKPTDFDPPKGPVFIPHHDGPALGGEASIEFCETSDHVINKKSYRYTPCIADPAFPSSLFYRQSESEPYGPHLGFEDSATQMFFDQTGHHVTTEKGFRTTRANVAIREGRFYWECRITRGILKDRKDGEPEAHGHVRLGFARRESVIDAPVGFDAYSYGIRDKLGQKVSMSRPKEFFPAGEQICEGDVIGLEIQLPSERLQRKILAGQYDPAVDAADEPLDPNIHPEVANIVRDRIPIRFKSHIYFEQIDYHSTKELEDLMNPSSATTTTASGGSGVGATVAHEQPNPNHRVPALRTLPGSCIQVYKNGRLMGTPFEDLLAFLPPASKPPLDLNGAREGLDDGMLGYYPAISVFRGGAAEANFGPNFWCPPAGSGLSSSSVGNGSGHGQEVDMLDAEDPERAASEAAGNSKKIRPVSERYVEQIVEDVVYDIVDEVDFWMQDGAKVIDHSGGSGPKAGAVGMAAGEEDIREVVQDD